MFSKILIANRGDRANGAAAQANFGAAEVKARSAGRSQIAGDHAAGH
jgi:hypothetical protein